MTDIDQLRAAEERLEQAQRSSDIEVLDELLHPEVTYVGPDGHLVDKHADLEAHRSGALRIDVLDCQALDVRVHDGVGVTVVTARLEGDAGGQEFRVRMRYTRSWGLGPLGWRVVAAHASVLSA